MLKVEIYDDDIKIWPNSGNFKVLSEEMLKFKVGDKIENTESIAIVKDQVEKTDIKEISFIAKTEFQVTNIKTGSCILIQVKHISRSKAMEPLKINGSVKISSSTIWLNHYEGDYGEKGKRNTIH